MKLKFVVITVLSAAVVVPACRLKEATNDLQDAIDDATKEDGVDACEQVMENVYSSLDSCTEGGALEEGQSAAAAASQWCGNCSDLEEKIDWADVSNCDSAIYSLECDALADFVDMGSSVPSACGWLDGDLSC
jgi:hypothetical protein